MIDKNTPERGGEAQGEPAASETTDQDALERQRLFGEKLRAAYTDVTLEPTPDAFLSLLDELEAKEKGA